MSKNNKIISLISDTISPSLHWQISSQHVRVCAARYGTICSKNSRIDPEYRDSPNTRNGARLRSSSPNMARGFTKVELKFSVSLARDIFSHFFYILPFWKHLDKG